MTTSSSISDVIYWDAHSCPPLNLNADLSFLSRYKHSGIDFVSLNVGFDLISKEATINLLRYFNQWLCAHNENYALAKNIKEICENKLKNKLSIAFDIEGCNLLNKDIQLIPELYALGVRQIAFSYNKNNDAGGGCLDIDSGLTTFGKQLVKKLNDFGIVIDCSHAGYKTSLEMIELSEYPTIFSHSNPIFMCNHPRNITDEQIVACAKKGGVIGINGVGIFLGNNDIRTEKIVDHIQYIIDKVGPDHVGIGFDCIFDADEIQKYVKNNQNTFPKNLGFENVQVAEPEQFTEIRNIITRKGYTETEINNILGGNFLRIAKLVWKENE